MVSTDRVGVHVLKSEGIFEIINFEETVAWKTLQGAEGSKESYRFLRSGPLLSCDGVQILTVVSWSLNSDGETDSASRLGIHFEPAVAQPNFFAKCSAQLINADSSKNIKLEFKQYREFDSSNLRRGWSPSFPNQIGFPVTLGAIGDVSKGWLHEGVLRIKAEMSVLVDNRVTATPTPRVHSLEELSNDLKSLCSTSSQADVTLKIGNETLLAHSLILGARSPVFNAMFSAPMREAKDRVVDLPDLDASAVKEMLMFLYAGTIETKVFDSANLTLGILKVAHRFEVSSLVNLCTEALGRHLTVDLVADWFMIADLVGCSSLRQVCLDFIRLHIAKVQATNGFAELAKQPSLVMEIMASLFPPTKRQRTNEETPP